MNRFEIALGHKPEPPEPPPSPTFKGLTWEEHKKIVEANGRRVNFADHMDFECLSKMEMAASYCEQDLNAHKKEKRGRKL